MVPVPVIVGGVTVSRAVAETSTVVTPTGIVA